LTNSIYEQQRGNGDHEKTVRLAAFNPDAPEFLFVGPAAFSPHAFTGDVPQPEARSWKQRLIGGAAFGAKATVAAWHLKPT
jgi:hypothetical protein